MCSLKSKKSNTYHRPSSANALKWWQRACQAEKCYKRYVARETNLTGRFPSIAPSRENMRKDIYNLFITVYFTQFTFSASKHVSSYVFSPEMKIKIKWPDNIPFFPLYRKVHVNDETIRKARMHELKKMRIYLIKRYETNVRKHLWLNN